MKQVRILFLFLLLAGCWNVSVCRADAGDTISLYCNIPKTKCTDSGKKCISMPIWFTGKNCTIKGKYNVEFSLWADSSCKQPIPFFWGGSDDCERKNANTYVIPIPDITKELELLIPRKYLDDYLSNNSSNLLAGPTQFYFRITLYDMNNSLLRRPPRYTSKPRSFNYSYIETKPTVVERYRTSYTQGSQPSMEHPNENTYSESGDFIRINYITSESWPQLSSPIEIRLSYWFDIDRKYPAYFDEDTEVDEFGHTYVSGSIATTEDYKGTIVRTNFVRRTRTDLNPFDIFVPSSVEMFAENEDAPCRKRVAGTDIIRDDTVFVFADIYKDGQCINKGTHYLRYFRFYKNEKQECGHYSVDTLKVWNIKREEISPTEIMVTYDVRLKCQDCGYEFERYNMMRTEFVDEKKDSLTYCPPHLWNTVPKVFIANDSIILPNGKKFCTQNYTLGRICVRCGKEEPVDSGIVYKIPTVCTGQKCPPHYWNINTRVEYKPLAPENGCNRQLEITHYDGLCVHCNETVEDLLEYSEKINRDCCPPHNWVDIPCTNQLLNVVPHQYTHEMIFSHQRKCTRCGVIETVYKKDKRSHLYRVVGYKCTKRCPIKTTIRNVPFRMNMVMNENDSSVFYIGATEVTQELWNAVLPKNPHGWKNDSKIAANEVTLEEVYTFIDALNKITIEQGTPLQFRLPKKEEWQAAYRAGKAHSPSETQLVSSVARSQADAINCYDMYGNVAEMIDSCITTTDEYGEEVKWQATMGCSSGDTDFVPSEIKWEDFTNGGMPNVGFRLVADYTPLIDEKGNLRSDVEPPYIEENVEVSKEGMAFTRIPIYRCTTCEKRKVGIFYIRSKAYGVKSIDKNCNMRLE